MIELTHLTKHDLSVGMRLKVAGAPGGAASIARILPDTDTFYMVPPDTEYLRLVVIFDRPDHAGNMGDLVMAILKRG